MSWSRRSFLRDTASFAVLSVLPTRCSSSRGTIGLGVNTYAFKKRSTAEAISSIAAIGFDSIELSVLKGFATEPPQVGADGRREIRQMLGDHGLALPQVFERIPILGDASEHQAHLERIRRDAQFAHEVNAGVGGVRPDIGTHLSGNRRNWEPMRNLILDRLHEWAEVAREMDIVITLKGHNLTLADTSEKLIWIMK